jgi:hypothetical protein
MEVIYNSIATRITEKLDHIRTIDEDYGQLEALDNDRDMYPLTFPAILIDIPSTEWSNERGKNQVGTAQVRVKLIIDCYDDTHVGSTPAAKINERAALVDSLYVALQGFRPLGDGELIRTNSRFYSFNHGIKVYETTFSLRTKALITETVPLDDSPTLRLSVAKL